MWNAPSRRCLIVAALVFAGCAGSRPMMAVRAPVVDLRAQPGTTARADTHDPLHETQLLYGEQVRQVHVKNGWMQVEAVEQPEFTHHRHWEGYPGWVPASALVPWQELLSPNIVVTEKWAPSWEDAYALTPSRWRFPLGTRLRATEMGGHLWRVELLDGTMVWLPHQAARLLAELHTVPLQEKRQMILRSAHLFLGDRYYWGGRSPQTTGLGHQVTGVDCSGLVNLAYRAAGIELPRDAQEQFLRARRVVSPEPADLVFLSERSNPQRIAHAMLYAGDGQLIEGPGTGLPVRRISVLKRLGKPLDQLNAGAVIEGQTVLFGSYLP